MSHHPKLSTVLRTHADSMWSEGWYTVSMRMDEAADALDASESDMTPKQYKAIIEQLGLSQERAGEWLGVSARTGQNYAAKGPPEPVAKLLRLMVRLNLKPEDVK